MLTHRSVGHMYDTTVARIGAIVMFGDPMHQGTAGIGKFPSSIPSNRIKTYCNKTDAVCLGTAIILAGHLTYGTEAGDAAQWVQSVLSGESGSNVGDDSSDLSSSSLEGEPESSSVSGLDGEDGSDTDDGSDSGLDGEDGTDSSDDSDMSSMDGM
jgi:Cutinase